MEYTQTEVIKMICLTIFATIMLAVLVAWIASQFDKLPVVIYTQIADDYKTCVVQHSSGKAYGEWYGQEGRWFFRNAKDGIQITGCSRFSDLLEGHAWLECNKKRF